MKNLKRNKNIIFLSNTNIALVVLNSYNNVLFAEQIEVNKENAQVQLRNLLTNAANFLGFNIKEADLIFQDYDISVKLIQKQFLNCANKEEVTRQIYKEAKRANNFVNSIAYASLSFNGNKANAIAKTLVSNYNVYDSFREIVKKCNVRVLSCSNIATIMNDDEELILSVNEDKVFACKYENNELVNCIDLGVNFDAIIENLANKFNCSKANIVKQYNLANAVVLNDDQNLNLSWNYDLKNRNLSYVKVVDFVAAWKDELASQIKNKLQINNWNATKIVTNNVLNNLNNTSIECEIVGIDMLSAEKVLCVMNADKIQKVENQSKFDYVIESAFEEAFARN